ncbi:MAG: deoxycytidylate deaminase [Bdellovibrionia bacterium]
MNSLQGPERDRPSFPSIYLQLAFTLAGRSTCHRLQVGTVITSTDFRKVLAVGYNGNATGLHNGCDRDEPGNCGCLHSEENAVINCDAPRLIEKFVFVTHLPCVPCAKRLINLGNVKKVFFGKDYRLKDSIELLKSVGIEVIQLPAHEEMPESSVFFSTSAHRIP